MSGQNRDKSQGAKVSSKSLELQRWMNQVPEYCRRARRKMTVKVVHDLRVAIRRSRSIADGLMELDPDPAWSRMKKAGKKIFNPLGHLRDAQVMRQWVRAVAKPKDSISPVLLKALDARKKKYREKARSALERFNSRKWKSWCLVLPRRARQVERGNLLFEHLALQRYLEAFALHQKAIRSGSRVSWHRLRIGVKRLRYTIENFLPEHHARWGRDIKSLQEILGEVHDLDVLWETLKGFKADVSPDDYQHWCRWIEQERQKRLAIYRKMMLGNHSLWKQWRQGLPADERLVSASLAKLETWSSFRDPDMAHARRVTRLSLEFFDSVIQSGISSFRHETHWRRILQAAALLHDVGRAESEKKHERISARWIEGISPPLGWTSEELKWTAWIARYHRGALPTTGDAKLLVGEESRAMILLALAGLLRLANQLDRELGIRPLQIKVESRSGKAGFRIFARAGQLPRNSVFTPAKRILESAWECRVDISVIKSPVK